MANDHILITDQQAKRQLADDIAKLKANPINRTTPGGYFLDPGGKSAHDAHGNAVPLRTEASIKAEVADIVKAEAKPEAEPAAAPAKAKAKARGKK